MSGNNHAYIRAACGRFTRPFLAIAFLLELGLWMRALWPRYPDLIQIVVTLPLALMLTAFTLQEFATLLVIGAKWLRKMGKRLRHHVGSSSRHK